MLLAPLRPPLSDVTRVAVLRANGVGDLVLSLPALEALRAAYPAAEIVLLARPWHATLLAGRPSPVDRVVAVPSSYDTQLRPGPESEPGERERFFAAMRAEGFDLAVQLHGGGRHSNPFLLALEARTTIGLSTPDAAPLDASVPYVYWQHEVLRYLEVVALAGAEPVALEPRLTVTAADREEARAVVRAARGGGPEHGPLCVLCPGSTDGRRCWPAESFAAVGDALAGAGARVAVTGTPDEAEVVGAVASAMRSPALELAGAVSLAGLAGLLADAAVVVANDSGPLHLAGAVGAATVGVYWCGILPAAGPLTLTRHRPLVSWRLACPVCGREGIDAGCEHRASFVADVPPAEAVAHALDLLARDGARGGRARRSADPATPDR